MPEKDLSRRDFLGVVYKGGKGLLAIYALSRLGIPDRVFADVPDFLSSQYFSETGFAVSGDFLAEYNRFGGLQNLGYPISRVFEKDGFPHQAFQRAILQWRKESGEAVPVNIMDELQKMGKDGWLYSRGVPRHRNGDASAETRLSWLTHPEIKRAYFANPYPSVFYGLPTSFPERFGSFITQRFQRGVLQLWLDEVSGMPLPGEVVGVLVGDWAKEAGFIPQQALTKEEPPSRKEMTFPSVIYHGDRNRSLVSLTVDDAWYGYQVERVLEISRSFGLKMTFFPVGRVISGQAELWRRAVEEGHEIGNHTFNHQALPVLSDREIIWNIQATENALDNALGFHYPMRLLRPPGGEGGYFGHVDSRLLRIAQSLGYSLAMWSVDPLKYPSTFGHVVSRVQNGDIVLFHFIQKDIEDLVRIIEYLKNRNLQPVTLSELFS